MSLQSRSPFLAQLHFELETWNSCNQANIEIPGQYSTTFNEIKPDLHARLLRFEGQVCRAIWYLMGYLLINDLIVTFVPARTFQSSTQHSPVHSGCLIISPMCGIVSKTRYSTSMLCMTELVLLQARVGPSLQTLTDVYGLCVDVVPLWLSPVLHCFLLCQVSILHRYGYSQRRFTMLGSDGQKHYFLVQFATPHLTRSDERMMQLHVIMKRLLQKHQEARRRDLNLQVTMTLYNVTDNT